MKEEQLEDYAIKAHWNEEWFFIEANVIEKFTDIDIALSVMNRWNNNFGIYPNNLKKKCGIETPILNNVSCIKEHRCADVGEDRNKKPFS
jgi:hypothetical protein